MGVDVLAAELMTAALIDVEDPRPRRRLAFVAIGGSGSSRGGTETDELLADGFGRDLGR
jgi:hypothetical protein